MKKHDFQIIHKPLFKKNFFENKIFSNRVNYLNVTINYLIRISDLVFIKKPCIAFIHLELLPYTSIIGEFILKLRGINYIIDIDDAVYHRYTNKNKVIDYLVKKKFNYIIKNAYSMYAGNDYHKKFFNSINNNIKEQQRQ